MQERTALEDQLGGTLLNGKAIHTLDPPLADSSIKYCSRRSAKASHLRAMLS